MASRALECDICCNAFSEVNCPKILHCSHTFCSPCINRIIVAQSKTCPSCRAEITASSAEDLIINRIVLDVVKQPSTINVKCKTLSKGPTKFFIGYKIFTKEILDEMREVFAATETLNEIKDGLLDTKKEIERFKEMLTDIELSIDIIFGQITEIGDQLEAATDLTLTETSHDAQEKVKKIKDLLQQNQRKRDDITQEILKMKARLRNAAEDMEKLIEVDPLVISAVKTIRGKQMVAPVRVKPRNQVCLSHFAEGELLPKPLIIQHEALLKTSSRRAFLDLAVGGTFLTRITIKVMDEGNLALNFLHVCAGDLGRSYANSQLSGVGWKGQAGEHIGFDRYGKSVMKVDWNKEKHREIYKDAPYKAGEVRGYFSEKYASGFFIVTRDNPNMNSFFLTYNNCFGIVEEEGLNVLRDAISQYPDIIAAIRIVDCGLMFSL